MKIIYLILFLLIFSAEQTSGDERMYESTAAEQHAPCSSIGWKSMLALSAEVAAQLIGEEAGSGDESVPERKIENMTRLLNESSGNGCHDPIFGEPAVVASLIISTITTTSIALSWSAPNGNAAGYRVEAVGNPSKNLTVNTLFTDITGLVPGSNYTLRVITLAADNVTEGDAVTISRFTKPDIVTNLIAKNITRTSITLMWSAPQGHAHGYRVEAIGTPNKTVTVDTLFTNITGLLPASNYTLQVVALAADRVTGGDAVAIVTFTSGLDTTLRMKLSVSASATKEKELESIILPELIKYIEQYLEDNRF
ncbi:receptor-type tyrosine-protein phosphatase eta-like isoform X2 [Polyodon spathula]|uniref:receptor-type tyrosine-protein phosphatase eta-like isoform X2 n=1 Tax=Polyodon spathula TaxID=7913 RepID=UPI001B7E8ECA|nr:receptor-type tyrosine-protein phosphatase eta-like isoform X2 [Polyodon spathula]